MYLRKDKNQRKHDGEPTDSCRETVMSLNFAFHCLFKIQEDFFLSLSCILGCEMTKLVRSPMDPSVSKQNRDSEIRMSVFNMQNFKRFKFSFPSWELQTGSQGGGVCSYCLHPPPSHLTNVVSDSNPLFQHQE